MALPQKTISAAMFAVSMIASSSLCSQSDLLSETLIESLPETAASSNLMAPEIDRPVDINSPDIGTLTSFGLITPIQENALRLYRNVNGPLIELYELQAVPYFDLRTIRTILPFIEIGYAALGRSNLRRSITMGSNELTVRLRHTVQRQKGYRPEGAYLGSRQGLFIRFTHTGNRLSFALLAEKDPGELWIDKDRNQLLDFQSFHILLRRPFKWADQVIVGDFNASFGLGLVKSSAFTTGKSALTTNMLRSGIPLRPLRSAREYDRMRGIGLSLTPHDKIRLNISLSRVKRDATLDHKVVANPTDTFAISVITSFPSSGYHRTESEYLKKQNMMYSIAGINAQLDLGSLHIETNSLYQHTNFRIQSNSPNSPDGHSTFNNSLGMKYFVRNILLYGEAALDESRNKAMVLGALIPLGQSLTLAFLYRDLSPQYVHLGARTFSETTKAENERGIYTGIELRPFKRIRVNAFADHWRHPVARFGIDHPGSGTEYLVRVSYTIRKKLELYVQWRSETKDYNWNSTDSRITQIASRQRRYFRIHFSHKVTRDLELRNRMELSQYRLGDAPAQNGFLMIQDVLYKPLGKPVNITARIAYFQTDSYNARIYAYENDLTHQFSIPAYSGNGSRCYLNFKYKGIRRLTVELRIAHTQMFDLDAIGSGNNEITGSGKTDLKLQFGIKF